MFPTAYASRPSPTPGPALVLPSLVLLAFVPRVGAQPPPHDDGPLVHLPALFSIDAATPVGAAAERGADGLAKRVTFHGVNDTPPVLAGAGNPDFSGSALLRSCVGGGIPAPLPLPDIDAASLGLDVMQVDAGGRVVVPPRHWSAMTFTVRKGTLGVTGSRLAAERSRSDGNQADFFAYVFRGADCIPPEFVDRTFKDADATELWLPDGAEVDAVDLYAALYERGLAPLLGLPPQPTLYFSVTATTVGLVPGPWWGGGPPSGATILRTTWNGSAWKCPTLAFTPAQLGLQTCEDVDAFAHAATRGEIVLSTAPAQPGCSTARDPLLYLRPGSGAPLLHVLSYPGDGGATTISESVGLQRRPDDDVDGVCIYDPACEVRTAIPIEAAFGQAFDDPRRWLHAIPGCPCPRRLELQAHLRAGRTGMHYDLPLVGGPPAGAALHLVTLPVPGVPLFAVGAPFPLPPSTPWPGLPVVQSLALPRLATTWDLLFYGVTADPGGNLAVTYPLRVRR